MGGDGSHGHGRPYEIPDWRIYKVEDVPQLMAVQKLLAQKGLRDPWLRNEVWRYHPGFGTVGSRIRLMLFRGFKWGFLAFLATIGAEKAYSVLGPQDKHSDHGDGHH